MKTTFTKEEILKDYWRWTRQTIQYFDKKDLIVTRYGSLSFASANQRANVIFSAIRQLTDLTGTGFGLLLEDPLQIIPAMIGVLKTRNYFTLLDVDFPKATIQSMIETAETKFILTTHDYLSQIRSFSGNNLTVINLEELNYEQAMPDPVVIYSPEDVVQILFTSGSTGQPKGAIEDYRYLCRAIFNKVAYHLYEPSDRLLQLQRFTFSATHFNVFSALLNGYTICYFNIKEDGLVGLPDWIRKQRVTCYSSTPSIFRSLASILSPNEVFPSVRLFKFGAEKRLPKDIQDVRTHFPSVDQIELGFASTETQLASRSLLPLDFDYGQEDLPSGKPLDDINLLIWDADGNSLLAGKEGEIVVHGDALARGYINNPQLTQERFIQDPVHPGWQYFKTGDLGKIRPDGQLMHLGRMDNMVKIKGIRIELEAIENHVLSYPGIIQVASCAIEDSSGSKRLAAYFVPKKGIRIPISNLRKHLAERLPRHLLPNYLIPLDELPLTDSGKVARNRLPMPQVVRPELSNNYVTPADELEKKNC